MTRPPRSEQLHQSGTRKRVLGRKSPGSDEIFILKSVPGIVRPHIAQQQQGRIEVPSELIQQHPVLGNAVARDPGIHRIGIQPFLPENRAQLRGKHLVVIDPKAMKAESPKDMIRCRPLGRGRSGISPQIPNSLMRAVLPPAFGLAPGGMPHNRVGCASIRPDAPLGPPQPGNWGFCARAHTSRPQTGAMNRTSKAANRIPRGRLDQSFPSAAPPVRPRGWVGWRRISLRCRGSPSKPETLG